MLWHSLRPALAALSAICLAMGVASAQYPTQYPPNQYPTGGQYPPNQYPSGGQYPPNQYPNGGQYPNTYPDNRLPGGIPMPNIHLPSKKPKTGEEVKVTLAAAEGTLRKLSDRDLLLQTGKRAVLRFRLLAKTKFLDKGGEPVRDSLLHPGDLLSVQTSPDDPETAVRITLVRSGTSAERSSAEQAVDAAAVRAPEAGDFGKAKTVTTRETAGTTDAPPESSDDSEAPKLKRAEGGGDDDSTPAPPTASGTKDPARNTDAQIIADARAAAQSFSAGLPDYLVEQVTGRFFSTGFPSHWQEIDVVTVDLAYVNGKEDYRNFRINGIPGDSPERSGTWSTGEFGTTLEDVMSPTTNASFKRRGEEKMAGRTAIVFDYTVAQSNSHWIMVSPDGRQYKPAYTGAVWIDRDSRRILRIEQIAANFPRDFSISRAETKLQYAWVKIEQKTYLLPGSSENLGCMSGSGACTRNAIEFKNYRKFSSESNITFGK
ncbi:MAG: hypothetical protein ABI759_25760 [Candidatus Solibacter sp.]